MTSLLPTWRFDGRCARTTSPATGASTVIVAQASISASSCSGSRFERRRVGAAASSSTLSPGFAKGTAAPSPGAEALGSSRTAGEARFGPARRACHAPCATTPARTMPPSDARATVRLFNRDPRRSGRFGEAHRAGHGDRDDARDGLLLHRHADQLLRHLHGDAVVADEEELRRLRHLRDELGIALGVGVVERRVDLVEQAERRRIELEDREHQRDRRQRLLAPREQVDRAVLLAGRLRHHLNAGVEDLVAGHDQARGAAAEQDREHAAEVVVDLVERRLQQLARLEVDLPDRVLERGHRLGQVGALRVEEALSLARLAELLERREIDGAERLDVAVERVDPALQTGELDAAFLDAARDLLAVGVGRVELLRVLRAAELRRLRLELERAHLVAQRLQRLLVAEPRFIGATQVLRQVVVEAALLAEALFVLEPGRQRALQLGLRRLVGELGVLRGKRGVGAEVVLQLLARGFDGALELLATRGERAQLELRFLCLALEVALRFAPGVKRGAGAKRRFVELGLALLRRAELDVERVEARLALLAPRRQLGEP